MAKCRICDSKIEGHEKNCPVCGCPTPLDNSHKTKDLTINLTEVQDLVEFKYRKKKVATLLTIFLDIFGIGRVYLGYKKTGIVLGTFNILLIISSFFVYKYINMNQTTLVILTFLFIYFVNFVRGMIIYFSNSVDANGDLLE